MVAEIGIALIGQKFMGRAHSNAWGQVGRFFDLPLAPRREVVAARDRAEIARFAERWGWRRWTTDWREIVADDAVELVDVGTPNHLHAEPAIAMLEAGKHVACEKPLAGTLDEARAMRDAAKRHKRKAKTFVWFNYRRCPAIGLAWKLMRDGRIGRVLHVRARYLQSWGGPETPMSWRFQRKLAGSGAHGDLNAHSIDLARFLVGEEIAQVHGALARTFVERRALPGGGGERKSDVDDSVAFLASFAGGATATFEATRVAHGHQNDNAIEINGEHGSLRFAFEDMNVLEHCDGREELATRGWRRIMCTSAGGGHPYAAQWWPDAHVLGYEHGFVNMAADVLRVLGGEQPELPLPDFEDAYQTQRVLEAASISSRERCAVPLAQVR